MAGACSMLCLILITIFIPPLGVFMISGCSGDFWINVLLTILGYIPGHVHAFYLEYVYYDRRNQDPATRAYLRPAPGVYSNRIQNGGHKAPRQYGTI
ncbi:Proteolipid membrane potential modulator [Penicillium macrosclerotiorum]|uniref:Proteolipid membrane potential modulator n=1 Tax=Penicillium macrosclerotiorum TaxID=303699 RepID=UPI0025489D0B|nr:Proteolipid membrane potential modulator [Penicillium macrosclerotiorum]KAJ5689271.1 Proteolipid membrane potential modulator [Penicillium macrosclerotiorum]